MADELDRALDVFRARLLMPFREDAALADDLATEARPVIEAIAFAIRASGHDPLALEYREGLAMGGLLGRRAALQRATPTASLVLVDAIVAALGALDCAPESDVCDALRAVLVEGYCGAIEERVRDDAAQRAARALVPWRIAPRCWAVIIAGEHAPDPLRTALDGACRTMLDFDARACLVHLASTAEPSEDLAREIFSFDATARMIGVESVFAGVDERWRAAARARFDLTHLALHETLGEGLRHALEASGAEVREPSAMVRRFRRLLGGERDASR